MEHTTTGQTGQTGQTDGENVKEKIIDKLLMVGVGIVLVLAIPVYIVCSIVASPFIACKDIYRFLTSEIKI